MFASDYIPLYPPDRLYVDQAYIQRNLRNRFKSYQTEATSVVPINKVEQRIDPDLVAQYIDERQAFLEGFLRAKYQVPLLLRDPLTKSIMQRVAGQLVISDIIRVYQYGSAIAALEQASPDLGYGEQLRREAINILESLCYQDVIGGRGGGKTFRGDKLEDKRFDLPGEILVTVPQEGPLSAQTIILGDQRGNTEYLKQRQLENIFSSDYVARGGSFIDEFFQ